jgi:agmatinase
LPENQPSGARLRLSRAREPAYAGVAVTFCRCPLALTRDDLVGADVVVVGAPFDGGTTFRPGTRFGPRAIRLGEDQGSPDCRPGIALRVDPFAALDIVDYGDIEAVPADLDESQRRLETAVDDILTAGATPVVLGGDHSLAAPVMRALARSFGADGYSVIQLDTHADTVADEFGAPNSNGTPFYRGVTEGFLRGANIFQVGLRGAWPAPDDFDWMRASGFRWRTMDEIDERGLDTVVEEAIEHVKSHADRTYLTIDIDVLDPAFAPGTGTPEPGGLSTREMLRAVRRIAASLELAAVDVVEVSPPFDPAGITAMAAHRVVYEALCGVAARRGESRGMPRSS